MIEDRISELEARLACLHNLDNREQTAWAGGRETNQSFRDQRNNSKIANSNIIGISEGEK